MEQAASAITYFHYHSGSWESVDAKVIAEMPVSLTVNGQVWLTFMCTPVDLEAMAVGFLFNERLISSREEVVSTYVCANHDNVDVWTSHVIEKPSMWRRTSGCTGGTTSQVEQNPPQKHSAFQTPSDGKTVTPESLFNLLDQLFKSQELYREVRGVHSSVLSDGENIWVKAEDIGRHNTLDKIAGRMLLEGIQPERRFLLTTGRISSEMLQKSQRMGASIVLSRTSPSSLSIRLAEEAGITLIGYARRDQFNVYTHPERVVPAPVEIPVTLSSLTS
ncbi:MAG: formate dehydrogenase accessory sulfurtransferase FdhD [Chloroflexi bacterium]|nr:formate dehydrogenase accessory sulfurtransferase FdhD [Chloroflexota bacterium]